MERKRQWRIYEDVGPVRARPRRQSRQRARRHNYIIASYSALRTDPIKNKGGSASSPPPAIMSCMEDFVLFPIANHMTWVCCLLSNDTVKGIEVEREGMVRCIMRLEVGVLLAVLCCLRYLRETL